MPLYNGMPFLADAIDSILSQTLTDFEFIIVDNGSTDGSHEYATSIRDNRIRVISESTRGPGMATNAGYAVSTAALIAIMDADDLAHPERLRLQTQFFDAHPEVVLIGTRFAFRVGSRTVPVPPQPRSHAQIRRALIDRQPVICNPSTMARATAVRAVGGHHAPGPGADFDFFLRMSDVGELYNIPTVLHYYRLHNASTSIVRMMDTKKEHSYGLACAKARADGLHEPTIEQFNQHWFERSRFAKLREYADCKALTLYREAIVERAQGHWISSAATITLAAMLSPTRTTWHLKRRLRLC